jgi:hypothetical protein
MGGASDPASVSVLVTVSVSVRGLVSVGELVSVLAGGSAGEVSKRSNDRELSKRVHR